jgi:hypothetical protein
VQKPCAHHIAGGGVARDVAQEGAAAFHAALDAVPATHTANDRIREAFRSHLGVVAAQVDIATVFVREWRFLSDEHREEFIAERRRYEERIRDLFREGVEQGELRTDLDIATAALLFLSAANWAYTWLRPGADTAALPAAALWFGTSVHRTLAGMNPLPNNVNTAYGETLNALVRGLYGPKSWPELAVECGVMATSGLVIAALTARRLSSIPPH